MTSVRHNVVASARSAASAAVELAALVSAERLDVGAARLVARNLQELTANAYEALEALVRERIDEAARRGRGDPRAEVQAPMDSLEKE